VLVRRDVPRIDRQDVRIGRLRRAPVALLLEHDAEVEIGVDEIGAQRKSALICARRVRGIAHALQCDAVTKMRIGIGGNEHQELSKRALGLHAVAPAQQDASAHAQQRHVARIERKPVFDESERAIELEFGDSHLGGRDAGIDEPGLGRDRQGRPAPAV